MSLNNFESCDVSHRSNIAFLCYGNKKAFCKACFIKHQQKCASSRCGDGRKISFTLLEKIEMTKLKNKLISLNPESKEYLALRDQYAFLYINFTKILKEHIERKISFLTLQTENWLLENLLQKNNLPLPNDNNTTLLQQMRTQIISILSRGQIKQDDLDMIIQNMNVVQSFDVNIKKTAQDKLRNNATNSAAVKQAKELYSKVKSELQDNLSIRDMVDAQIQKRLKNIYSKMTGQTISTPPPNSYQALQKFEADNTAGRRYDIELKIQQLEDRFQELLEVGKNFLKESLFQKFKQIKSDRDFFPYKNAYIINTSPFNSTQYEKLILNIEKNYLFELSNTYENGVIIKDKKIYHITKKLVIIGQQLIQIEFTPHQQAGKIIYQINIYGFTKQRQEFYKEIPSIFGFGVDKDKQISKQGVKKQRKFDKQLDRTYYVIEKARIILFGKSQQPQDARKIKQQGESLIRYLIQKVKNEGKFNIEAFNEQVLRR